MSSQPTLRWVATITSGAACRMSPGSAGREDRLFEQPRRALPDHAAVETLARPVNNPRRVDRPVTLGEQQLIRVFVGVMRVGQTGVVAAFQQMRRHDGLRGLVDDRL